MKHPLLKSALIKPADHLSDALTALEETDFVNPIDAASLALIFPIVHRSLRGRSGAQKRKAAQITATNAIIGGNSGGLGGGGVRFASVWNLYKEQSLDLFVTEKERRRLLLGDVVAKFLTN